MKIKDKTKWTAALTGAIFFILCIISLCFILLPAQREGSYIADIYQEGELLTSIPLAEVQEVYTFTITGTDGCQNRIEVRPGSIGIIFADCPDKLCVHQGFISDSRLPLTCLPNRLVIRLRAVSQQEDGSAVDIITY